MLTISIAVLLALVSAILVAWKKGNFWGWAFGLGIPAAIIGFIIAGIFTNYVPTSTVVNNYTRPLVDMQSGDKLHAQASFMNMFGIVGGGSGSADEQYTYEFWAQNRDGSASHFKLQDGADNVRVFQDAPAGQGTWTVRVTTPNVSDKTNKWYKWGLGDGSNESTTVNYFHVPPGTINQQFKMQ